MQTYFTHPPQSSQNFNGKGKKALDGKGQA
jgi:hypothetical protein